MKDRSEIEEFIEKDPYVTEKLVTGHELREWTVVVGAKMDEEPLKL